MSETNIDDLKTMTEAPDSLELRIGLADTIHTYQRVSSKPANVKASKVSQPLDRKTLRAKPKK